MTGEVEVSADVLASENIGSLDVTLGGGSLNWSQGMAILAAGSIVWDGMDGSPSTEIVYRFEDADGRGSKLQVLEWQAGALYWNCLRACEDDEAEALAKVRQKYLDQFIRSDLHFFLGTTQQWHSVAPNPWVIVGVFPIPHEIQLDMF